MVNRRKFILLALLAIAVAPTGANGHHASAVGSNRTYHPEDRGYFKIVNLLDEDLFVFTEPTFSSKVVMPIKEGEIVASDGIAKWGGFISWRRIALGTVDGWIPERQIIRARLKVMARTSIPVAGTCRGYAPVWMAKWNEKLMRLSLFPGRAEIDIANAIVSDEPVISLLTGHSGGLAADLIQTAEFCAPIEGGPVVGNAGMLVITDPQGKRLLSGCCQADAAAF